MVFRRQIKNPLPSGSQALPRHRAGNNASVMVKPVHLLMLGLFIIGLGWQTIGNARAAPKEPAPTPSNPAAASAVAPKAVEPKEVSQPPHQPPLKGPNAFNRLLRKGAVSINLPPTQDGIHDPESPGTQILQSPAEAFQELPKSQAGNHVDWVKALKTKKIQPRFDVTDTTAEPAVLDLNIIREVKGSMPNVLYPHKQHTEWLECTNCHDEIFIPEKGKNQISMAGILLGQACGVCHGKVAFPLSDCRRCHSKPKTPEQLKKLVTK